MNYFILRVKQIQPTNLVEATHRQMVYEYEIVAEHSLYLAATTEIDELYRLEFNNHNQYVIAKDMR